MKWVAWGLAIGIVGCGASEPPPVVHPTEVLQQSIDATWELGLEEQLRLGSGEEGASFYQIRGLARDEAGRIYVLDAGNHRIAVFDAAGRFLREFGSAGEGPGEFLGARSMWLAGDTIAVTDQRNRLHLFWADGTHVRTRIYVDLGERGWIIRGAPVRAPDGWMLTASSYFQRDAAGSDATLPPLPKFEVFAVASGGDLERAGFHWEKPAAGQWSGGFWVQAPFTHSARTAMDGMGRVHVAETDAYVIDVYGSDGQPIRRIVNAVPRVPVAGELLEGWKASRRCEGSPECFERNTDVALSLSRSEFQPVVGEIRGFVAGYTAVRRRDLDPDPFDGSLLSDYDFFDPDGHFIGRLPGGPSPRWFDGETLLVVERDSLRVEYVVQYRVR